MHQQKTVNLLSALKARVTRKKGKGAVLNSHFYVSTAKLRDAVLEAEKETLERTSKKGKKRVKAISYQPESGEDTREEAGEENESNGEDFISCSLAFIISVMWSSRNRPSMPLDAARHGLHYSCSTFNIKEYSRWSKEWCLVRNELNRYLVAN